MIVVLLALRDLWRDRAFLFGNVAVFVGMLTPLLVLYGVKNGVYQALIGELLADPAVLQIDTVGNASFTPGDIAPVAGWPDVAFVVPRPRSQFDLVALRAAQGRPIRDGLVVPSGAGDPSLPRGLDLTPGTAALSAPLAAQLGVSDRLRSMTATIRAVRRNCRARPSACACNARHHLVRAGRSDRCRLARPRAAPRRPGRGSRPAGAACRAARGRA